MADETLLMLASEVRGKTLRLLAPVNSEEEARFTTPGLSNSILWHAGHALIVVEQLSVVPVTLNQPAYPAGWFEKFAWKSEPAKVKEWPSLAEVVAQLQGQLERLQDALRPLAPARLDAIVEPEKGRTLRYSILHGLHDEAGHQGEIYLLRKLYGKRNG